MRELKITSINFLQKFHFQKASFLLLPWNQFLTQAHTHNQDKHSSFSSHVCLIFISSIQTISAVHQFSFEQIKTSFISQQLQDNSLDSLLGPDSANHCSCELKICIKDSKPVKSVGFKHMFKNRYVIKFICIKWRLLKRILIQNNFSRKS